MWRRLAHLPVLDGFRAATREALQERDVRRVLGGANAAGPGPMAVPPGIEPLRPRRVALPKKPVVVTLGHDGWERFGLWPTLARISAGLEQITIPPLYTWGSEARKRLARDAAQRIEEAARRHKRVDVLFMYCDSKFVEPSLLEVCANRGIWTIVLALDDQHRMIPRTEHGMEVGQQLIAARTDVYWTTWRRAASYVSSLGGRPFYAGEGADPSFHRPLAVPRDLDVVFVGAKYGVRRRLIEDLRRFGIRVAAYGHGWEAGGVSFEKTVELFSRAKIVLGSGNVGEMERVHCLKGRDFEVPMCGAAYVTSYNPDLCDWFEVAKEVHCYSNTLDCVEVVTGLLADEERCAHTRAAARKRSLENHTWQHRFEVLFSYLRGTKDDDEHFEAPHV